MSQNSATIAPEPAPSRPVEEVGRLPVRLISPVLQFTLLIVPLVMTCFFMVYSLVGWILEGQDRFNWSLEAETVALWVGAVVVAYSVLTMALIRWLAARAGQSARWHPVTVSGWGHIIITVLLIASVFITVRL